MADGGLRHEHELHADLRAAGLAARGDVVAADDRAGRYLVTARR